MCEKRTCSNCIGYLTKEGLNEPSECPECHKKTLNWIQFPDSTYGVKCSSCGTEAIADLNTECELDCEIYHIEIKQQILSREHYIKLSKLVGKNSLQTKKELSVGSIVLEGNLSFAWKIKPVLEEIGVEFCIHPVNMEERYFYARKCGYCYATIS